MTQEATFRVVAGIDFGPSGDLALLEALGILARRQASELHIAHVLDPRDVIADATTPVLDTEEQVVARAPEALRRRALDLAEDAGLKIDPRRLHAHARVGRTVETLIQFAVDYQAHLLVVGTHGRRGVDRLLLGSVAERLMRVAPCPVLVARPLAYEGLERTKLPDEPYTKGAEPAYGELPRDVSQHISTEIDSWRPSDAGPTGFRIV